MARGRSTAAGLAYSAAVASCWKQQTLLKPSGTPDIAAELHAAVQAG